ncbi:hypothetical protein APHAL10511_008097 [Amanita phalloides]|nr:hypothetical protein APHAL10511_008097 [Amanita phalloides]
MPTTSSRPSVRSTTPSKSRIPATAGTPTKASSTSTKTKVPVPRSPVKPRAAVSHNKPSETENSAPGLSIKEAIALRRAEAKKLQSKSSNTLSTSGGGLDDEPVATPGTPAQDEDSIGRLSLRQTIERARSTGSINIATRSLPCLPSALFELHLGITPEPLKSVLNEPPLPPPSSTELRASARRGNNVAWYEAQDLHVLKAWNNDIIEIQPEISLFGSLKTIDLHQNKIIALPESLGDLMSLTNLDLSQNELTSLPDNLFSLPELMNINVSHNRLTALPFNSPFMGNGSTVRRVSTNFFSVAIERASSPLPRLHTLDASHNRINASAIHLRIPASLTKFDLSFNPLDDDGNNAACREFVETLGRLSKLTHLHMEQAGISNEALPASLSSSVIFPHLRLFDLAETKVTVDAVRAAFKGMKQTLDYNYTTEEPSIGVCRVITGKKMLKEAWEIEIENQTKPRSNRAEPIAELTTPEPSQPSATTFSPKEIVKKDVVKESWEIEADKGLLTEGGKRRARAVAAGEDQKALGHGNKPSSGSTTSAASSPSPTPGQNQSTFSLSSPKYYSEPTLTLTLPPCTPSKAVGHSRAFSLATTPLVSPSATTDIAAPIPTLPLSVIVTQPFANSLRTLVLVNRRLDRCFALPGGPMEDNLLPSLEELDLENCYLPDAVAVSRGSGSRTNEPIIPLITKLFHNLQTLNLSYNALNGALQDTESLSALILARAGRRGLRHLRLGGNGIKDLDGLQGVASMFKGFREVPGWKLDELDIRDNNIEKLPPVLGLLPLDVFLVEGNLFRVPQRRVWEREGTKGLLSWLRSRIE